MTEYLAKSLSLLKEVISSDSGTTPEDLRERIVKFLDGYYDAASLPQWETRLERELKHFIEAYARTRQELADTEIKLARVSRKLWELEHND